MNLFSSDIKATAADWIARRDAGLSDFEAAELQAWLDADSRHRETFAKCDSAWNALDRPYQAGSTDELLSAVQTNVRRRVRRQSIAAVAGLVALVGGGFFWQAAVGPARDALEFRRPETAIVVRPSSQVLPDHSVVELNAGAEIAADFRGRLRRVVLEKGEAHFQVAADASRPFVVLVGKVEVRAVGTAFSVQRGPEGVEVLVTEGRVAVEKRRESPAAATELELPSREAEVAAETIATVGAGYRARVGFSASEDDVRAEVDYLPASEMNERLAWRAPRLEFSGATLAEAVALLNEQAVNAAAAGRPAQRYAIGDAEIASMRVSGLFRVDNTESFVRLLQHGFGIEAELSDNSSVMVLRKARAHR